jgi:hypothetical protein
MHHATAQRLTLPADPDTTHATRSARLVLKFAPFTLLELQNTAEVAVELPLRDRFSLQAQFGYAPNWLAASLREGTTTTEIYTQREYWRVRLEPRWYSATPGQNLRRPRCPLVTGSRTQTIGAGSIRLRRITY